MVINKCPSQFVLEKNVSTRLISSESQPKKIVVVHVVFVVLPVVDPRNLPLKFG